MDHGLSYDHGQSRSPAPNGLNMPGRRVASNDGNAIELTPMMTFPTSNQDGDNAKEQNGNSRAGFLKVFHFATALDWLLIVLGVLAAAASGAGIPILTFLIRDIINEGFSRGAAGIGSRQIREMAWQFLYIGYGIAGAAFVGSVCLQIAAARQGLRVRIDYLRGLLRQEMAWQDAQGTAALAVNFESDCADVQAGLGDKLFLTSQNLAVALGSVGMGLSQGWKMTLILLGALPFLFLIAFFVNKKAAPYKAIREQAWQQSSGILEETLSGIRTTASLAAEGTMLRRFRAHMRTVQTQRSKEAMVSAVGAALLTVLTFGAFALGLWFGSWLQVQEEFNKSVDRYYNGADSALCFISVLIATFYMTQVAPGVGAIRQAAQTIAKVVAVTERKPPIDVAASEGLQPELRGQLQFKQVSFVYPTRPDTAVLQAIDIEVPAGRKVALVGGSGSGKSSVLMLVMRFYDPTSGQVLIDGQDIRDVNVKWLRQQIGFVSQEPVLFATTVQENVRLTAPNATQQEVEAACVTANAHDFVQQLPDGYGTMCGERGAQMSGGQKQRIAIARSIIANPKILLLDEATSALDAESERLVQAAIDQVSAGRTTLIVAHRLSSVREADRIVVVDKGRVLEEGDHATLMRRGQAYAKLVQFQTTLGTTDIYLDSTESADQKTTGPGERARFGSVDGSADGSVESGEGRGPGEEEERNFFAMAGVTGAILPRAGGGGSAMLRIVRGSARFPAGAAMGCFGVVMSASIIPLLSYMIVEMTRIYFFCFQVDTPIFIAGERDQITAGYYDGVQGCDAACDFNIINGRGVQGTWMNPDTGTETACTLQEYDTLCLDVGRFSIKFYRDRYRFGCYDEMTDQIVQYCIWVILVGVAAGIAVFLQSWGMRSLADNLAINMRLAALAGMLRQNIAFFDSSSHSPGILSNLILQDATLVQEAAATTFGLLTINLLLAVGSMALGIYRGWVLALICIAVFPGKFLIQFLRAFYESRYSTLPKFQRAAPIAVESATAVRTVAANSLHERLLDMYVAQLPRLSPIQGVHFIVSGLLFGISLFAQFAVFFTAFLVGANFMIWPPLDPEDQPYSFLDVLQVFFSIAFMGFAVQLMGSMVSDLNKALKAAARVFACIDTEPTFSIESNGTVPASVTGQVDFRDVVFSYPQREDALVLDRLSFSVAPRATTALVGTSGSGKSTVIQLIERFYDPAQGQVLLDGVDVRTLDLRWLRRQIALVSQEPVLFNGSIAENIRYGSADASDEEVERAARKANAHTFISQFQNGYGTLCGERGAQMSGGQKQRIAIARSIIANPKILLLDEATSALDAESERLVQGALDKVAMHRTCIVVAHRLSTIQAADKIVVLSKGKIVEEGSHSQLLAKDGAYARLVGAQLEPGARESLGTQ